MLVDENNETTDSQESDRNLKNYDVSLCKICIVLILGIEGLNMGII